MPRQARRALTLALIAVVAPGCVSQDRRFEQASEIAHRMLLAETAGSGCPWPMPAQQDRERLARAIRELDRPGLGKTSLLSPLDFAVIADDPGAMRRFEARGYAAEDARLLHGAALHGSLRVLDRLLADGADPDGRYDHGTTALMVAAAAGRSEATRRLLDAGASPRLRARDGSTALHHAIGCGDRATVELLLDAGAEPDARAREMAVKKNLDLRHR